MAEDHPSARARTSRAGGLLVAGITLVLMLVTEPGLAIVWDEGFTLARQARMRLWFQALADPPRVANAWDPPRGPGLDPRRGLIQFYEDATVPSRDQVARRAALVFDPEVIGWFWPFAREEPHGHPPFYALVGLLGDVLVPGWDLLPRARFGPMLVFSLTAGAIFAFVARRWGVWPATLAAGAWVLQPRLFGHGHYATYDALLTDLWVNAILAFARAVEVEPGSKPMPRSPRWGWVILFGVLAGWAAVTKMTGWFLPLPFLAWTLLYRDRRGLWTVLVGGLIGAVTLYLFNPVWWADPIGGLIRFFQSNLSRGQTIPIPVLFLGQIYDTPNESLPPYNTLVWTVFVTPIGLLILAVWGAVRALGRLRSEPVGLLFLGHWAFLLLLRALPHTPGHDGVRQFLPAFGCLALVAGLGAATALERLGRWAKAVIVAALIEGAVSIAWMMPVPLSYYSPLVGGLPGASALGMEPTYYWDALSDDALDWLQHHTGPGQKVLFATNPYYSWLYLWERGRLPDFLPNQPGTWRWYVVQNRPGALHPWDPVLITQSQPSYVVRKGGVPLVWVFPYHEVAPLLRAPPAR